jgi:hypothetical protein
VVRTSGELVRTPFEKASWGLRHDLIWPLEDSVASLGRGARATGFGLVVLLAAAAGVAGLLWASPDRSPSPEAAETAALSAAPARVTRSKPKAPPAPALHGVSPVFTPATSQPPSGAVGAARAIATASRHHHFSLTSPAASEVVASTPKARGAATASAARQAGQGRPAGPAAIAVAREFANAFVLYETGQSESGKVRRAFGRTTTPDLRQALLRRPPRQPAHVKVPKARVLNVVAAPSRSGIYPVSVSLLRVGLTSELRLSMERLKGKRWLVTNVLG